jgi:thiol-disulfide isomerase/thioredoxin
MQKLLLLIAAIMVHLSSYAINGFKIKGTITNNTDSLVYLCNYYGKPGEIYKVDSAKLTKGTTTFNVKKDTAVVGGIYILLFADRSMQFEVLINNGDIIELEFDKSDPFKSAKFKGSPENTDFYAYQNYVQSMQPEFSKVQDFVNKKTKKDSLKADDINKSITEKINVYRSDYTKSKPKTLLTTIFNALKDPEIPEAYNKIADTKTKDSARYRYYKDHYWDSFNFQDDRIIYSPIYDGKIENYYKNLVAPQADSMIKEISTIMNKAKGTKDIWKYSFWWQARYTGMHKVMGVDEAYVWMIENYVMRDLCPWLDDTTKKNYEKDYARISPGLMGKPAAEMILTTIKGAEAKLSNTVFSNDYTIIAFYDPTCHHCQEEIPDMDSTVRSVMKKNKIKIKVFGIENASEEEKWKKMIEKDKLTDDVWVHVYDPKQTNLPTYRSAFNVVSNPTFYVLDAEGKIVGKRVDHTNVAGLFEFLEKKKKDAAKQ